MHISPQTRWAPWTSKTSKTSLCTRGKGLCLLYPAMAMAYWLLTAPWHRTSGELPDLLFKKQQIDLTLSTSLTFALPLPQATQQLWQPTSLAAAARHGMAVQFRSRPDNATCCLDGATEPSLAQQLGKGGSQSPAWHLGLFSLYTPNCPRLLQATLRARPTQQAIRHHSRHRGHGTDKHHQMSRTSRTLRSSRGGTGPGTSQTSSPVTTATVAHCRQHSRNPGGCWCSATSA